MSSSPLFLALTPLLPGVKHFPAWKASPVALSSPHRGFYAEDGICKRCSSPCRKCEGNATNCQTCEGALVLDQGVCQETCSERHVAVEGVCKHCPEMCQECIHEKTCKGTWQAIPAGGQPAECGMSKQNWGTFTNLYQPLCMSLTKVRVR